MQSEFEFINKIKNKSRKPQPSQAVVGIGDDCAVLPKNAKTDLVITTDLIVEDIDFRTEWTTPEFLGHKALAVSLSDIAAMGAKPVWSMTSIGIPQAIWKTDFVERFYEGYFRLAEKYNVELIGGDVSKTPDKIVIDSIVAGETKKGKAVLRSGAKAGDLIFVTGELGGAAGGLKLLESGFNFNPSEEARQKNLVLRQLQPSPQISSGDFLSANKLATAMIDLSDGLSGDLRHICRASNTGAKLFAEKIPFDKNLNSLFESFEEKIEFALNGGEDFELLFTVNPKKYFQAQNEFEKRRFSLVGEITANVEMIELIRDEKSGILQPKGFRHF
ncbi:MAG: thiamine-phosphate kinase [Acidobacteria bacterium]|nr:thiamine-phosphate kinase [Acidobacteriota bacterium]